MSPNISVITPVRATREEQVLWLSYAIQSVLDQTYEDWEMVVIDDASTVSLESVVKLHRDPRIRWGVGGGGVSASRNLAASMSGGKFLLPLDADDKLAKNAMELFLAGWEVGGHDMGFVYSDVMVFGQDFSRLIAAPYYDFDYLLRSTYIPVGALHLTADWKRVGGWKEEMEAGLEDWEYWIALGELGVCGWRVGQPLYWYRRHPESRLSQLRAGEGLWGGAYAKMRDLHRDVYRGRKPMGCCGGGRKQPRAARKQAQPEPEIKGKTVLMEYVGRRQGSFYVKGFQSGIRYRVPGKGSRFKIDVRDLSRMEALPSIRRVREQPRMVKRATPPAGDALEVDETAFSPVKMEEKEVVPEIPDPNEMTVSHIRSAAFKVNSQVAAKMIELERAGKNRKSALKVLKRKL